MDSPASAWPGPNAGDQRHRNPRGVRAFTGGSADLAPSRKTMGWARYVGTNGLATGISHSGASAPAEVLYEKFGMTALWMANEGANLLR
jgi:transketolase